MTEPIYEFTWGFQGLSALEWHTDTGIVFNVHWELIGRQEGTDIAHSCIGALGLVPPEDDQFIPLEQLTEELVIEWVKTGLGDEIVAGYIGQIKRQIEAELHPVTTSGLPWYEEPEEPELSPDSDPDMTPPDGDPEVSEPASIEP